MLNRIILIVLDGFGVGALPDAKEYQDEAANTLYNLYKNIENFCLPNFFSLGLYELIDENIQNKNYRGSWGKMLEASKGKDTTTGHWEIAGLIIDKPFPTYPQGFPEEIIKEFERRIGKKTIGNFPCSGTKILELLGEEHIKTGYPIIYTSADSVFQIAAHEEIITLEELYYYCKIARDLLGNPPFEEHKVVRVIARPFIGKNKPNFIRTKNRRDFSIKPFDKTILDYIKESEGNTITIGKLDDIFANQGISKSFHTSTNEETMSAIKDALLEYKKIKTLIFANFVDFDTLWGHRRDILGYYQALKKFDIFLENLLETLNEKDLLIITSDHGNDPTYIKHTDHTREYVPLIVFSKNINFKRNVKLEVRKTFADIAKTIEEIFELKINLKNGTSFAKQIFN
ncbi:MAG: phosphopentomutase [Endomicrobia bacterium]|nr:phosphopentomutase [Endomicrobiia bacterium]